MKKKDKKLKTFRFEIVYFDDSLTSGIVKPFDKDRSLITKAKVRFKDKKIQKAIEKSFKIAGNGESMVESKERDNSIWGDEITPEAVNDLEEIMDTINSIESLDFEPEFKELMKEINASNKKKK